MKLQYMGTKCVKPFDRTDFISLNDNGIHFFLVNYVLWKDLCDPGRIFKAEQNLCACAYVYVFVWSWPDAMHCYSLATQIRIFFRMIWMDNTVTGVFVGMPYLFLRLSCVMLCRKSEYLQGKKEDYFNGHFL